MEPARAPRRVLYVWDADYPWDIRTEKVCRALVDAGHPVAIAARNSGWLATDESLPEGRVLRLPPWRAMGRALDKQSSFPAFFNPRWISHITRTARLHRADVIIVRDLPLAPTALWVGRHLELPVVLDMAENYPAMIRDVWRTGRARPLDHLVRNPAVIRLVEEYVLPRMDHVITVVEESSDRVAALGVPRARITCVSNTPPAGRASGGPRPIRDAGPLKLTYLGLMEMPRGIMDVLGAVALLQRDGVAVEVEFIGDGRDLPLFRARAAELGLSEPTVRFRGRLENRAALEAVATADVGLVPHHADESWNTTIPNKLFDYMAAGLPVISSDAVPAARVVRSTGAGLVYRSEDAGDLADRISSLRDVSLRGRMATAGREAIRSQYNWESDTAALLQVVNRVMTSR
jgi:glycosyltransferase involved in cell wall biosynthesis